MGCVPSKKSSYKIEGDGPGPSTSKKSKKSPGKRNAGSNAASPRSNSGGGEAGPPRGQQATAGDMVEVVVCQENELENGQMKQVDVADAPVLLVKDQGKFFAVSGKCTHYGASLAKGAYCKGIVRCPWHGACFSVETGDIEDFPGLDSLHKYQTRVTNGQVVVMASKTSLASSKRRKPMSRCTDTNVNHAVVIAGGGAAALACAETLRQEGFPGKIAIIGKEASLPYDRPKLSKSADIPEASIYLRPDEFYRDHDIEVIVGTEVKAIDFENQTVHMSGGEMGYGNLVIATGGDPRTFSCPGHDLDNICYLRTPSEARKIHAAAAGKNVVIVGTSFIGMEEAAALMKKVASMTIVGSTSVPFERVLGPEVGAIFQTMFEKQGVKFYNNQSVTQFRGVDDALTHVVLKGGQEIAAEVCIGGIGVLPATRFLMDTKLSIDDRGFINVNEAMQTNVPNVYACGDIVNFPLTTFGNRFHNVQHWQMAMKHGKTAALDIVGKTENCHSVPFFWSVVFGKSLRYAGVGHGYDDTIIHGDMDKLKFICYYLKNDVVIAVASLNRDPTVAQVAELMRVGRKLTRREVERQESDDWSALTMELCSS